MAALGRVIGVGLVDLRFGTGLAQRTLPPAGTALLNQALDGSAMSNVWFHEGGIIFTERPCCPGMAVQSPCIFGACVIFCRHHCSSYLGPQYSNQSDGQRTLDSLDFGRHAFFGQLDLCYFICGVRLA